ncbi:iron uptake system protein EfeO [Fodinicola acaciae]|uniref:iron uptake system protein EfeO n=1 Tax=Fodinicola acaciae TaxID=2681555 RepID=UPI0013D0C2C1|nr:iron uptake system protein EfeO [Fodinicola acaciae]
MRTVRSPLALAAVAVAGLALIAGCGGSPAATGGASSNKIKVTLTDDGCTPDRTTVPAGSYVFSITNQSATKSTEVELLDGERIMGEKENLTPGLSGEFTLALTAGTYSLYCPGAKTDTVKFTVTGAAAGSKDQATAALLKTAVQQYAAYVKTEVGALVTSTKPFVDAVKAGNVAQAKQLYAAARVHYERVEPVAESFSGLDPAIDARENDVPAAQWTGFHKIEQALWVKNSTAGMAPVADKLLVDVQKLNTQVAAATYQPAQLANGAGELLSEVSKSKITGEEERYSHIDLVDIRANVDGAKQAYAPLVPALKRVDATLANTVSAKFAAVDTLLDKYKDAGQPGGYKLYTQLAQTDTRAIAQAIDALAEAESKVAGKVVGK